MNAMMKAGKMLALMPIVALAAACNGVAPTSSTDLTGDLTTQDGAVTAQGLRPTSNPCKYVESIHLQVIEEKTAVLVEATYKYSQPSLTTCSAPTFTSNVRGLHVDATNPFRARLLRTAATEAKVTATAPNGVSESIQVVLQGPADTDPPTSGPTTTPNDGVSRPTAENACKVIDGVNITVQPPDTNGGGDYILIASYSYSTPTLTPCAVAPAWSASRRGLTVNPRDGFRASIGASSVETTVYATAPTGVQGKTTF